MPRPMYSKLKYRRKRPNRRLSYMKGARNAYALAKQAASDVWYLKGLVNSEMLHKDTVLAPNAQSSIDHLTSIAQGDGNTSRTGNSILLRNIYIRGNIAINSAVASNTRVTFALVKDLQQVTDTVPTVSDIFDSSADPDSMLKLATSGRYKVLWRKTYVLTPVAGGRNAIDFHKYWKIYDHVRYNGSSTSDIQKNGYYFVMINSESTNYPVVGINCRIGYHDN